MKTYKKLKKYIEDHGIKQEYISDKTNISSSILSAILNGKRKFDVEEFILIVGALNTDPNTIIYYQNLEE